MGGRGGSSHRQTAGGTAAIQTFLQNAYGANHANAVLAILQNAPAHIRALWEQYAAQFRATNMRRDEGAFYSPRIPCIFVCFRDEITMRGMIVA